jgi:hypothetical protein
MIPKINAVRVRMPISIEVELEGFKAISLAPLIMHHHMIKIRHHKVRFSPNDFVILPLGDSLRFEDALLSIYSLYVQSLSFN